MPASIRPRSPGLWGAHPRLQTPPRSPRAGLFAALLSLGVHGPGCSGDGGSTLERRAGDQAGAKATPAPAQTVEQPAAQTPGKTPEQAPSDVPAPVAGADGLLGPGSGDKVLLRLAFAEGLYRATTVGMAQFPMMPQATGFAREESLTISGCEGEGSARTCLITRATTNFEAEPPYGKFIEGDEAPVRPLTTRQRLRADGSRVGEVTIEGPPEALQTPAAQALSGVTPFFCIRFPDEPVGVGARWQTSCVARSDGRISERTIIWELTSLTDDPDDGKRAELREVGNYTMRDPKGDRSGSLAGSLLFFVDAGLPHVLREAIATDVVASQGLRTQTSYNIQFARVDPGDPKKISRVDGKPFPEAPPPPTPETPETPKTPDPVKPKPVKKPPPPPRPPPPT